MTSVAPRVVEERGPRERPQFRPLATVRCAVQHSWVESGAANSRGHPRSDEVIDRQGDDRADDCRDAPGRFAYLVQAEYAATPASRASLLRSLKPVVMTTPPGLGPRTKKVRDDPDNQTEEVILENACRFLTLDVCRASRRLSPPTATHTFRWHDACGSFLVRKRGGTLAVISQ